ncbi:hypothetical protein HMPREF1218_0016 [Hoylesella pleuritidis F0068]|uniref:Uncharacterized protein n=1 Tax=Hoylesella pleuritidis F0068 TaxID=1081904 RepID=U2LH93_9BACT|nr:hypothetical protein HMPREF1218_0016 [Hoylesella pleuritidis F0068]
MRIDGWEICEYVFPKTQIDKLRHKVVIRNNLIMLAILENL